MLCSPVCWLRFVGFGGLRSVPDNAVLQPQTRQRARYDRWFRYKLDLAGEPKARNVALAQFRDAQVRSLSFLVSCDDGVRK